MTLPNTGKLYCLCWRACGEPFPVALRLPAAEVVDMATVRFPSMMDVKLDCD